MNAAGGLALVLIAASTFAAVGGGGCGGESFCGDGDVDPPEEECDDGNNDDTDFCLNSCLVRPIPTLTVKWSFNADEERGFSGDSCTDTGGRNVLVDIDGPQAASAEESCSFRQVVFSDIPAGSYTVTMSVVDGSGALLTGSPVTQTVDFAGGDEEVTINVPYDAWTDDYDGNFFFNVTYGGQGCAAAGVDEQSLTFTYDDGGGQVAGITKAGAPLDGTPSPCYSDSETEPQTILDVPFGPATLVVQGLDVDDNVVYESTFETFIGAGLLNPEQDFDVAPVP